MRIEDNLAEGMSAEQARRDALIRFGSATATKERVASMDAALVLDSIWSDIRFSCRQLITNRASPSLRSLCSLSEWEPVWASSRL
jgi:macrolide transport system ATP-binding/permease protein